MFRSLTVRGPAGAILWGYRTAAVVRSWAVVRARAAGGPVWTLTATVERVSPFELRQSGLMFSAPREGGFFVFPLLEAPRVAGGTVTARVGPPEH